MAKEKLVGKEHYKQHMIKKILTSLFLLYTITLTSVGICSAANTELKPKDLMARLTLDNSFKPENSPGEIIASKDLQGESGSAVFGNYLLQVMAGALISIAAPIAIVIIAIAGLIATVSHGDDGLIKRAKDTLKWAVIGLIVIIFSWVIVRTTISIVQQTNSNQPNTTNSSSTTGQNPAPGEGKAGGEGTLPPG